MSTEAQNLELEAAHPQAAEALRCLQKLNSTLEEQMQQSTTESFTATDEDKTVQVTLTARVLTGLYIEEGLLRLGAETVQERINEALLKAQAAASAAFASEAEHLYASIVETTGELMKSLELS